MYRGLPPDSFLSFYRLYRQFSVLQQGKHTRQGSGGALKLAKIHTEDREWQKLVSNWYITRG